MRHRSSRRAQRPVRPREVAPRAPRIDRYERAPPGRDLPAPAYRRGRRQRRTGQGGRNCAPQPARRGVLRSALSDQLPAGPGGRPESLAHPVATPAGARPGGGLHPGGHGARTGARMRRTGRGGAGGAVRRVPRDRCGRARTGSRGAGRTRPPSATADDWPQLPGGALDSRAGQRQLRRRLAPARADRPGFAVGRALHVAARLGAAAADWLLAFRLDWEQPGRRVWRTDRLLRRRSAHQGPGAVCRVFERGAGVCVGGPALFADKAHRGLQGGAISRIGPGGVIAHRGPGRGRRRGQRPLPPGRDRAGLRHGGPVRLCRTAGGAQAPQGSPAGDCDERGGPGRDGHRRGDRTGR